MKKPSRGARRTLPKLKPAQAVVKGKPGGDAPSGNEDAKWYRGFGGAGPVTNRGIKG